MQKRVTSQDVAELAGVSRTTVSFALNDDYSVKLRADTRERVKQAAKELGYTYKSSSPVYNSNHPRTFGLIFTRDPSYVAQDAFVPRVISEFLSIAKELHFHLRLDAVETAYQIEAYQELTNTHQVDGLILVAPIFESPVMRVLEASNIPVVMIGGEDGSGFVNVDIDNQAAMKHSVKHLIELGHTQIALILGHSTEFSFSAQRLHGYREALDEAGIPFNQDLVYQAAYTARSGYWQMKSLIESKVPFTAVLAFYDAVAHGAMAAIRDAGLNVPNDVSIVGFGDFDSSAFTDPPLTTLRVPIDEIVRVSCEQLQGLIDGNAAKIMSLKLPSHFILRGSTQEIGRNNSR